MVDKNPVEKTPIEKTPEVEKTPSGTGDWSALEVGNLLGQQIKDALVFAENAAIIKNPAAAVAKLQDDVEKDPKKAERLKDAEAAVKDLSPDKARELLDRQSHALVKSIKDRVGAVDALNAGEDKKPARDAAAQIALMSHLRENGALLFQTAKKATEQEGNTLSVNQIMHNSLSRAFSDGYKSDQPGKKLDYRVYVTEHPAANGLGPKPAYWYDRGTSRKGAEGCAAIIDFHNNSSQEVARIYFGAPGEAYRRQKR